MSEDRRTVSIRLYPPYEEAAGKREVSVEVTGKTTLGEFLGDLHDLFPGLQKYLRLDPGGEIRGYSFTCLVDGVAAGVERPLHGGEQIMILPPMEGG